MAGDGACTVEECTVCARVCVVIDIYRAVASS